MLVAYEETRLQALQQLNLLDTPASEAFDRITRMAAQLFNLPIAAVSLTDHNRQWFKSRVGVAHCSIPREKAPCAQVADSSECVVLPDLLADDCYRDSPLAQSGIRFYAGAPLTTREGFCLGAMCVLGTEPRQVSSAELSALTDLAAMVMAQIELQHAFGRIEPSSGLANRNQFIEDLTDLSQDRPPGETRLLVLIDLASPEQLSCAARVRDPSYLDDLIRRTAQAISSLMGPTRKLYHVAPTQFALLALPDSVPATYAGLLTKGLDSLAFDPYFMGGVACGIAPFELGVVSARDALRTAHSALQDARAAGSRIGIYSSSHDAVYQRRFRLQQDFVAALEMTDQLKLVYQPRIDLASGRCVGAEALLRWTHPDLGPVSPGEFVPLVEQTSLGQAMTAWVLETAMRQLAEWNTKGLTLQLSVNVSAINLAEQDFAERTQETLLRHDIAPQCLELEVTEGAVMQNAAQGIATLQAIAEAGISIAIDDFGTGYSSLSYLQRMPAHVVKIDQSFTHELLEDRRKQAMVTSIVALSHDLGYRVVVEGVEEETVLDLVRAAGCDEVQGYLFARPMPPAEFRVWFEGFALSLTTASALVPA
ncbi:MAG: sensor domain-containing phosphodiesterase [Janthinobacterium lividum]